MVRPRRCRRVRCEPNVDYFKPSGIRVRDTDIINLTVDEFEAIRLVDNENMEQIKAAQKMEISQPTLHRLLSSAHNKIADALCNGKAIKIKGGEYMIEEKGVPKRDGSGKGIRKNRGRGGCNPTQDKNARQETDRGPGRVLGRGQGPCGRGLANRRGRNR
ncbi:DUF134 domain-containing protein [Candidatus Micrarchaeota archaeon]|nr:DUF134 domain-containing protein [Candidatus Micrarchaeota archaeon]